MGLDRGADRGREPGPQLLHLAQVARELAGAPVGRVEDLFRLGLRLADQHLRLLDRGGLEVVAQALRGREGLLQNRLVGGELLDLRLQPDHLLAVGLGLPDQRFVVLGDHLQEGVDLVPRIAADAARKRLIADVERCDSQRGLRRPLGSAGIRPNCAKSLAWPESARVRLRSPRRAPPSAASRPRRPG